MENNYEILVVDDDREDHLILSEYFRDIGIENRVHYVENGKYALEYMEKIALDNKLPRLVILDLNMPIMNGTQTLLHMKQSFRLKNVPVIIFSTSENETEKRKCLSLGAVDYLVKPVSYNEGLLMVNKFRSFLE
ncbi:response regulator [Chryseosolibacter indicus]|uniref:Response regulator n=1 Tax=Chryseosolibacter indicus TaxID=2782351 RepID=A0ABS5VXM5_9BACT|nr:response regulator [Chryseosolibacter indicus]MBT1706157.1 response regulator [Chryseosolibacter indicus]